MHIHPSNHPNPQGPPPAYPATEDPPVYDPPPPYPGSPEGKVKVQSWWWKWIFSFIGIIFVNFNWWSHEFDFFLIIVIFNQEEVADKESSKEGKVGTDREWRFWFKELKNQRGKKD